MKKAVVSSFGIADSIPHSSYGKMLCIFPKILGKCKALSVVCKLVAICRSQGLGGR